MREYIFCVPDENQPIAGDSSVYYPDERDEPMCVREEIVRCRDCRHSRKDGTLCMFFASWEPIACGDEYAEMPADVEPDGFCAWGIRREA